MQSPRSSSLYLGFIVFTIALGLLSRTSYCPDFLYLYLGDALYALLFFFVIGFLFPKAASWKVFVAAVLFCYCIEVFQLYQADWINDIRATTFGRLVLGSGFLWSDIVSYTVGGLMGWGVERSLRSL